MLKVHTEKRTVDESGLHGTEFAEKNTQPPLIKQPLGGNERTLSMSLQTQSGKFKVVSSNVPTLEVELEVTDHINNKLNISVSRIASEEEMNLLGDFNASVGRYKGVW